MAGDIHRQLADLDRDRTGDATGPPPANFVPYVANALVNARVEQGGFTTVLVKLNASVTKGQPVATVADPFGRVVETVVAPVGGRVAKSVIAVCSRA